MQQTTQWQFGPFRLDLASRCLWRERELAPMRPKTFEVLAALVMRAGEVVTKEALLDQVWPDTAVSDTVLKVCLREIRQILGDSAKTPTYVATVHRRGYRFIALVTPDEPAAADEPLDEASLDAPPALTAERRQLTVLCCDLVDSTALAARLDPEDFREILRAHHQTCAAVIHRFDGYLAQYLGDGVLGYFGYPTAHEDDPQRAVRAGLGILAATATLSTRFRLPSEAPLAVRLGVHTGLVVVGDVGTEASQGPLALGETPHIAARLQGAAAPHTLLVSAATWQLLGGFFAGQTLGATSLQGLAQPLEVYRVISESTARSRLDVASRTGLTPLVGREQEVSLLLERWTQVKEGFGQVVLISGEAGIGKSRLVQVLKEHVATEPQAWLTPCQCSPYYQNTALYPMLDLLERVVLRFDRESSLLQRFRKLEGFCVQYGMPLAEVVPLFAALLSLPLEADYPPLSMSPEQQKQKTLQALLTIVLRIAAQQPLLFVMEDLHWVDPSTLELLGLLVNQGPTARILVLLTFRPDFSPPWMGRSHLTQMTLPRLARQRTAEMIGRVARGKAMPAEVVAHIAAKTDGVPLFVEELTKMVLESDLLQEGETGYDLTGPLRPLAIPATLHDSLMARLDRLGAVKGLAQLGATLGREFPYALLQAVAPWDEETMQQGLRQLVEAEFLYQRGMPPAATYLFKHALIQDAAYQSLLRSTRQQYHQHIARVLETRFSSLCDTQPELLAHHYTEAEALALAVPYWQQAGQRAIQRSANLEAIGHLSKGIALLAALPDTPERIQQELDFQLTLGPVYHAVKGQGAPEVEHTYARARELCGQLGETPQLFPVLWGLWYFYFARTELRTARELSERLLHLAERLQNPALRLLAHRAHGQTLCFLGELSASQTHLEQAVALYDFSQHRTLAFHYGQDPAVVAQSLLALLLWLLGFPDQAVQQSKAAISLAESLEHPYSLAYALIWAATVRQLRRDRQATLDLTEAVMTLSNKQSFALWEAWSVILQGWDLAEQGRCIEGMAHIRDGIAAWRVTRAEIYHPHFLIILAKACAEGGRAHEGLGAVAEALGIISRSEERLHEAEIYRLKGVLLQMTERHAEAETCLSQALDVARRQQAKSLELRAAISLSQLWQRQGKPRQAHQLLAAVCDWFTEGCDTADLRDAKALLETLA